MLITARRLTHRCRDPCWRRPEANIQVKQLLVGQCYALPFRADQIVFAQYLINLLYRLEHRLMVLQYQRQVTQNSDEKYAAWRTCEMPLNLLQAAFTTPATRIKLNYERLEFFGDSLLKMIVIFHVFVQFPHDNEGSLTLRAQDMQTNKFLGKTMRTHSDNIPRLLLGSSFSGRLYQAAGLAFHHESDEWTKVGSRGTLARLRKIPHLRHQSISQKSLADVCEAWIAGAFLSRESLMDAAVWIDYLLHLDTQKTIKSCTAEGAQTV